MSDPYERIYNDYMGDVKSYLDKVQRGRSTRKVDPNDPALDERADQTRQLNKQQASNLFFKRFDRTTKPNDRR